MMFLFRWLWFLVAFLQRFITKAPPDWPRCRRCGCWEYAPCVSPEGMTCWWAEPDLCYVCHQVDETLKGGEPAENADELRDWCAEVEFGPRHDVLQALQRLRRLCLPK